MRDNTHEPVIQSEAKYLVGVSFIITLQLLYVLSDSCLSSLFMVYFGKTLRFALGDVKRRGCGDLKGFGVQ